MPENIPLKEEVIKALKTCFDPEIPVNIYELGLVYRIDADETGKVEIDMTLTSPNCPSIEELPQEVQEKVKKVEGVSDLKFELVWEPPFSAEMMSEDARLELGLL